MEPLYMHITLVNTFSLAKAERLLIYCSIMNFGGNTGSGYSMTYLNFGQNADSNACNLLTHLTIVMV